MEKINKKFAWIVDGSGALVEFVEEEWDTEDKILRLNELDALYNNISLEKVIEITK